MDNELATWLIQEIEERGWSQRELARRARLSHTAVSSVISGERNPGYDFCVKVAKALNRSQEEVLRMGGLLPPLPASEAEGVTYEQLWEVVKRMTPEERREIYEYARYRLQREQEEKKRRKKNEGD